MMLKRCIDTFVLRRHEIRACRPRFQSNLRDNEKIDTSQFESENIRNFSIIAHVDHGKSTLADRLLESTGTISADKSNHQVLDRLKVERERGITVKAQTASMFYQYNGRRHLLNLIDTPGHVDFSYEVSRSLAACQGAVLLVDATQGVQAQTVANFFLAFGNNLSIVPVINKIDLPNSQVESVTEQLQSAFDIDPSSCLQTSGKTGTGVRELLDAIIERIPPPSGDRFSPFHALLFDSWFDTYRGAICLIAVKAGQLRTGDVITCAERPSVKYTVGEIGLLRPQQIATGALYAGQVGYIVAGMRHVEEAHIGDTIYHSDRPVSRLEGFRPSKPMVFAGLFPVETSEHTRLLDALNKLTLNDASVTVEKESSSALGQGWRLGFLGMLHMEVFQQRLLEEYGAVAIITAPTVPYKVVFNDGKEKIITSANEFPDASMRLHVRAFQEPMVTAGLIFPVEYLGPMMTLCEERRGAQKSVQYLSESRVLMRYEMPLSETVVDFHDTIKSRSSGYASFDYEDAGYKDASLVKLDILLNGKPVDALSTITHKDKAYDIGRHIVDRLKDVIHRQLYDVAIQAAVGTRVISRENIKAMRKNVTAKCYGGDVSRKMKLLNKQKEGKKRMKLIGSVELSHNVFLEVLKQKKS